MLSKINQIHFIFALIVFAFSINLSQGENLKIEGDLDSVKSDSAVELVSTDEPVKFVESGSPFSYNPKLLQVSLSRETSLKVEVYDTGGKRRIYEEFGIMPAGIHRLFSDELDSLESGTYFAKIYHDYGEISKKFTLLNSQMVNIDSTFIWQEKKPNPFCASSSQRFILKEEMEVTLKIYSINAELLKTIELGRLEAGPHLAVLNLGDVESGYYILIAETEKGNFATKLILLK